MVVFIYNFDLNFTYNLNISTSYNFEFIINWKQLTKA